MLLIHRGIQFTSAAGFTGFSTKRLASKGNYGPNAKILSSRACRFGSGDMNLTKAVLFSSSVNLKLSTCENV